MKKLIGSIGDRLQAIFPPNRIMLGLAGPITAASVWLSAWATAHVPGVTLPVGVIAGAMGLVALITVTLIYKWFDQWQQGEPLSLDDETLSETLAELEHVYKALYSAHGTVQGVGASLGDLHDRISKGSINEAEIVSGLEGLLGVIGEFVGEHQVEAPAPEPAPAVAAPQEAAS